MHLWYLLHRVFMSKWEFWPMNSTTGMRKAAVKMHMPKFPLLHNYGRQQTVQYPSLIAPGYSSRYAAILMNMWTTLLVFTNWVVLLHLHVRTSVLSHPYLRWLMHECHSSFGGFIYFILFCFVSVFERKGWTLIYWTISESTSQPKLEAVHLLTYTLKVYTN